jgi:phage shock protein PspC (stress-responsive transcriptional regulator)
MKKTLTINLGGIVYHIDEDAYTLLKDYLDKIKQELKSAESKEEIYNDIESRIAEIIGEKIKNNRQVVSINDIQEIIKIMGEPEDITGNEESGRPKGERKKYKRIYRDPDERMIGGVCSGLAAYWNLDPTLIRVIFALLAFFGMAGIFIYLVLWIVLPEAITVAQKLEMRGEDVTLSSITDFMKDEFENVKRNFKRK